MVRCGTVANHCFYLTFHIFSNCTEAAGICENSPHTQYFGKLRSKLLIDDGKAGGADEFPQVSCRCSTDRVRAQQTETSYS
jgi:hypothetical protein